MANEHLHKLCSNFDHTYVLTIERAKERQASIKQQMEGCSYEFLFGMDNRNETKEDLIKRGVYSEEKAKKVDSHKRVLSLGDVACSWGQREIYRSALSNGFEKVMIFEDDVRINPETIHLTDTMLAQMPPDADLIYWGWEMMLTQKQPALFYRMFHHLKLVAAKMLNRNGYSLYSFPVIDHQMVSNAFVTPYNDFFMQAGAHYCTHAYSVTAKACQVLLDMQTPVAYAADHLLIHAILHKKIKAYIAFPQLFMQDYTSSNPSLPQYTERDYINH